jgi:hypothetical protein
MPADSRAAASLTDEEFLERFERRALNSLSHSDHIRLAFIYARRGGVEAAVEGARRIRGFAADAGATDKYHETLTVAWARIIAHLVAGSPEVPFPVFIGAHPELQDRGLLLRHYSQPRLSSEAARAGFLEPDLLPLPG